MPNGWLSIPSVLGNEMLTVHTSGRRRWSTIRISLIRSRCSWVSSPPSTTIS